MIPEKKLEKDLIKLWEKKNNNEVINISAIINKHTTGSRSGLERGEIAGEIRDKIQKIINRLNLQDTELGLTPRFKLISNKEVKVVKDVDTEKQIKQLITLSGKEFQDFCKDTLEKLGAEILFNKYSKERGIDIAGIIRPAVDSPFIVCEVPISFVCQITISDVGEPKVSRFLTPFSRVKNKKGKTFDQLPKRFRDCDYPLIGIMICRSNFKGESREVANSNGIVTLNIRQLLEKVKKMKQRYE
ncbi:MAG: hypothetical protein AB1485_00520 [Candidatus Thermoplasmatota archaeon]